MQLLSKFVCMSYSAISRVGACLRGLFVSLDRLGTNGRYEATKQMISDGSSCHDARSELRKTSFSIKLNPGLSLIEVMLAVLILGISVTTLLSLQGILSRGVYTGHAFIIRIAHIRNYFVQADLDKLYEAEPPPKKVLIDPELTLTYRAEKPASKGLKSYQNILIERVEASWPTVFGQRNETFGMLRFAPKPPKGKS